MRVVQSNLQYTNFIISKKVEDNVVTGWSESSSDP